MTRAEIREKVQVLLDEYSDQGGWETAELNHMIGLAAGEVSSLFLALDDSFYLSFHNFSLQPTVEQYDLPNGFLKIKRVCDIYGVPLTRLYQLVNRYKYIGYGAVKLYYLQGNKIGFLDIPTTAATFPCLYVRQPITMDDDGDSPDVPEYLGHDLIVLEAANTALATDEEQNPTLMNKAEHLKNQITEIYSTRNVDFTRQVPGDEALDDLD